MFVSSEAFAFAKDQIKRARGMTVKANLFLSKAELECQVETILLENIKAERFHIQ